MKCFKWLLIISFSLAYLGCTNKADKQKKTIGEIELDKTPGQEKSVKKIFFNLPSPIELTQTILATKSPFNPDLLNPVSNVENYNSSSDLALNFGVYGADLCYCRVYDQLQSSISYLASIRKITDLLQIPEDEGAETINRIEENIENRDSIFQIIAETYAGANGYLKENERDLTAAFILVGGWIEGMYFAVNLLEGQINQSLINSIAEQKYSLENMMSLISDYKDNPAMAEIYPLFEQMSTVYSHIEITHDEAVIITDQESKITTIDNEIKIDISNENLQKITRLVIEIRTKIVS
jgi:hypothetical protein